MLGLIYPFASIIGFIVREKQLRQKELMKMMSVSESDINWAWFMTFLLFHTITATCCALMAGQIFANSDRVIMWIFWFLSFLCLITFAMALATITANPVRGILIGLLIFFTGNIVALAVNYQTMGAQWVGLISLHPIAAFSFGLQEISRLEDASVGLTLSSIMTTDAPSGIAFNTILNSLFFDSVFWGFFVWYLNRVIPPEYGQAYPLYFPFMPSYWRPRKAGAYDTEEDNAQRAAEASGLIPVEPVGEALQRQSENGENIVIQNLTKKFGDKAAVNGLNLIMYNGHITALLGHNGAGKTTTIAMLTGAFAPTSGTANVIGNDIRTQMQNIRGDIGVCLQHDCLFPNLTVREHVQFFSRLKGLYKELSYQEAEEKVDQAIRDVALFEKRNVLSKNLSGGMKRKLSVAMAFCGGSKVVLLDEPTSGMDPFSRRFTWNVIRQYRRDRCIILTTHFMDEAEILGDRIAIMAEGQLRCAGSALFLKKKYGVGYQLVIEKERGADGNELQKIVEGNVADASLLSNVGSELSYQLPMASVSKFGPMFDGLDQQVEKKSVSSYGVSVTTLDEVFLLVARGDGSLEKEGLDSSGKLQAIENGDEASQSRMDLESKGLFFRHVGALFKKRAAFFKRDKKAWLCTSLLPGVFVFLGFLGFALAPEAQLGSIKLDLNDYNAGVKMDRNPIAFNSPGQGFDCNPGGCMNYPSSGQNYVFCGGSGSSTVSCSISSSDSIMDRLKGFGGAFPYGGNGIESFNNTGELLVDSAKSFE